MNDLVKVIVMVFSDGSTQFFEDKGDVKINSKIAGD